MTSGRTQAMSDGTKEAAAAARWWADRLVDGGDIRTGEAETEDVLRSNRSRLTAPTAAQVETFRAHLEAALLAGPIASASWRESAGEGRPAVCVLRCDYDPDQVLRDALQAAGIKWSWTVLPPKTAMWVKPGSVKVKHGYGAGRKELPV